MVMFMSTMHMVMYMYMYMYMYNTIGFQGLHALVHVHLYVVVKRIYNVHVYICTCILY